MRGLGVLAALTLPATAIPLVDQGKPAAAIVLANNATAPERTAAREIADYLRRISGANFPVLSEDRAPAEGTRVFIGATSAARRAGLTADRLGPEEWILRTLKGDVVIVGGQPRGTLYAAYHFLEDVLGVRWWNPFEESVPQRRTVRLRSLNLRGKPALPYRDIYLLYGRDGGRFAARNRLNREGDAPILPEYGGSRDYGPPYHVHTFNHYFPPREFLSSHPEWYALVDGKRLGDGGQLCLTDPGLRQAFLSKLLDNIRGSWSAAEAAGAPPPLVFSVSQNDCLNPCACNRCQAIARAEESECGPLLDFVNYLADGIRDVHPEVYLDTLAYQYTQNAPRTIRPRDNVIVRLCDTESDPTWPITAAANTAFRQHLSRWAEIAANLRVWDYGVTYAEPVGMPMPTAHTYGPDYRFYAEHHVEGVFTELEFEILADMRDLKVWTMMKQLEDPAADFASLVRAFSDGFYGPGGKHVRRYLASLEAEARARQTRCNWVSPATSLTYLNLDFINRAQQVFDKAERAVQGNTVLLRRVRHARLPLDRASLVLHTRLVSDWIARGRPLGQTPPDREIVGRRVLDTWTAQAKLRLPESAQEAERWRAEAEVRRYAKLAGSIPLPEKFRHLPTESVHDFPASMTRNWGDLAKVVKDPTTESGVATRLDLAVEGLDSPEKYSLPMPWGLYATAEKQSLGSSVIRADNVPGPGYHWYRLGTFPITPSTYAYFFWSWIIQVDLGGAHDPARPDRKFEVWARIRFQGPRFPHSQPGDRDAIHVERVVLVEVH